jgi:hypothetical protein
LRFFTNSEHLGVRFAYLGSNRDAPESAVFRCRHVHGVLSAFPLTPNNLCLLTK